MSGGLGVPRQALASAMTTATDAADLMRILARAEPGEVILLAAGD